jgi:hypothetical protein
MTVRQRAAFFAGKASIANVPPERLAVSVLYGLL